MDPYRVPETTQVVGHRGNPAAHPDNTIEGILAATLVADMVEIDVRRTRDDVLVLSHDAHVGERALIDHRADAFDGVDSFLDLLKQIGEFPLNIEIKNDPSDPDFDPGAGAALRIARLARPGDLITSFHWPTMEAVHRNHPGLATGLLVDEVDDLDAAIDLALGRGHVAVAPHWSLLVDRPDIMWDARGLAVNAWTVNDSAVAERLVSANISAIITDDPTTMRALIQEHTT
jgi:glycerophosphoryl diester phosphodiesterase